jgi:nucleoside-diphosphate-sugar epimerase
MTQALVTGATGFLGGHMARRLAQLGWKVTGMGRNEAAGRKLEEAGIAFIHGDLRHADTIRLACARQQFVFHCGALSSPWGPYRDFYECNVEGTRHVAEGCRQQGVERLIHISTPSIYFNYKPRLNIKETDPLPRQPVNAYAATKLLAERVVMQAHSQGLLSVILRPRAIFGPGDQALFPRLLKVNNTRGVPMLDGGQALIDLTYVDNVADAMLLCCNAPEEALGRAYNISGAQPLPFRELMIKLFARLDIPLRTRSISSQAAYTAAGLLELAYRMLPMLGEPSLTRFTAGSVAVSQTLDISLARKWLGYIPQIQVEQGLDYFAQWWREQL